MIRALCCTQEAHDRLVRVPLLHPELISDAAQLLLVPLADGIHLGVRVRLKNRDKLGAKAQPDNGHSYLLRHGRVLLVRKLKSNGDNRPDAGNIGGTPRRNQVSFRHLPPSDAADADRLFPWIWTILTLGGP